MATDEQKRKLAETVERLRGRQSYARLAERLGVTTKAAHNYAKGKQFPADIAVLKRIADMAGCRPEDFADANYEPTIGETPHTYNLSTSDRHLLDEIENLLHYNNEAVRKALRDFVRVMWQLVSRGK